MTARLQLEDTGASGDIFRDIADTDFDLSRTGGETDTSKLRIPSIKVSVKNDNDDPTIKVFTLSVVFRILDPNDSINNGGPATPYDLGTYKIPFIVAMNVVIS